MSLWGVQSALFSCFSGLTRRVLLPQRRILHHDIGHRRDAGVLLPAVLVEVRRRWVRRGRRAEVSIGWGEGLILVQVNVRVRRRVEVIRVRGRHDAVVVVVVVVVCLWPTPGLSVNQCIRSRVVLPESEIMASMETINN